MSNIMSYAQIAIGAVLVATGFLAPIGYGLIVSGALGLIAGVLFKPPRTEASDETQSSTYGFAQFDNPVKGDSALPVIYSNDVTRPDGTALPKPGHKTAPIYISAFTTPRGWEAGDDDAKIISARGQGLSALLAIGEGPITDVYDIRINDDPLHEERFGTDAVKVSETVNGTRKVFTIPGARFEIDSVRVSVAGVLKGWKLRNRPASTESPDTGLVGIGDGSKILFVRDIDDATYVSENAPLFFGSGDWPNGTPLSTTGTTGLRPHVWMDSPKRDGAATRLFINTQVPMVPGGKLFMKWTERFLDGFTLREDKTNNKLEITFATAPASGAEIKVEYRRRRFPGVRIEWRRGGDTQIAIPDFNAIRNTTAQNKPMAQGTANAVTFTTSERVDNVVVDLASGTEGFTEIDATTGNRSPARAQFRIQYRKLNDDGTAAEAFRDLRDPSGARTGKTAQEFEFRGDQLSQKFYSLDIRGILREVADRNPGDTAAKTQLAAFTRSKYGFQVWRTNVVRRNGSQYSLDEIQLVSFQQVLDEYLSYPGVAMLGLHAIATERLSGTAPRITCKVRGLRDVERWQTSQWLRDELAQASPVWAAIDLITNPRYGGGQQFTKAANIDTASATIAADWCAASVTPQGGIAEKRAVIDIVLDTRADLMEHVRTMLLPAQVVPVLRGNVWCFLVDRDVNLTTVATVRDDGTDGRTLKNSMTCSHPPVHELITELQLNYFDRDDDFEKNEIWRAPITPENNRRIQRATAIGIARTTQATRYAGFLYEKARRATPDEIVKGVRVAPVQIGWAMTPGGLRLQAGDVCRVISTRLGIDLYARIMRWEIDSTETIAVKVEAVQYVPSVYSQDARAQTILTRAPQSGASAAVGGPTKMASSGQVVATPRMPVTVRRVA